MNMEEDKIVFTMENPRIIHSKLFRDNRGWFYEAFNQKLIDTNARFIQDNHSYSELKGTIRGLHLQRPPYEQAKFIRVLKGKIFDVVVDLRPESEYYLQVRTYELDSNKKEALYIPKGFAHGFMTMEDHTEVYYKVDEIYSKKHELTIHYNDSDLNIPWPKDNDFIMSDKDERGVTLKVAVEVIKG